MIELMMTLVFVTLGLTLIQGSFLRSADMLGRYSHTLKVMDWMNQQCAKTKENFLYSKEFDSGSQSGVLEISGKSFSWVREIQPLGEENLHSIRTTVQWSEGGKPAELKSESYVYKNEIF